MSAPDRTDEIADHVLGLVHRNPENIYCAHAPTFPIGSEIVKPRDCVNAIERLEAQGFIRKGTATDHRIYLAERGIEAIRAGGYLAYLKVEEERRDAQHKANVAAHESAELARGQAESAKRSARLSIIFTVAGLFIALYTSLVSPVFNPSGKVDRETKEDSPGADTLPEKRVVPSAPHQKPDSVNRSHTP